MSTPRQHDKLIAAAAKAALAPIGCTRVGRSRTWISDHGFWLVVIEFQPSSWERGSYLNVGAMWLWMSGKGLLFHHGYRIGAFIPFVDAAQFKPGIESLATLAAQRTLELRKKFNSIKSISTHLATDAHATRWMHYHAAMGAGLAGDYTAARFHFEKFALTQSPSPIWPEAKERARKFNALLDNPALFHAALVDCIAQCRATNKLSPVPGFMSSFRKDTPS